MKRKISLNMKSLEEARALWLDRFRGREILKSRYVFVEEALGRVTAEPVFAGRSVPHFHSAAMDGVAVYADATIGATERSPKRLFAERDAFWINTGQPLPEGCDAVIMVEKLHQPEEGVLEVSAAAHPWQNVRKVGEDFVASELLFPRNHRIRPIDVGALLAAGIPGVRVWERPSVAIIPTGNELVRPEDAAADRPLAEGVIVDSNSAVLAGMVRVLGGAPSVLDIVPDDYQGLVDAVDKAVRSQAHMVIINAGSSAGSEDYTAHALETLGQVLVHGVAMMPGKPTVLAEVSGKPVIGNPGYSVSAAFSFDQFARPLLVSMQGLPLRPRPRVRVHVTRPLPSKLGVEEFLRVNLGRVGDRIMATPLPRGAGSITTLTRAEGIIRIPELSQGLDAEQEATAELLVDEEDLERTLVVIGSHDMSIDVLADLMKRDPEGYRLSSANVGSLGGLKALRSGHAHVAGSHLLDPETGEYNTSYVRTLLQGMKVSLFHLVRRDQGLMVAKGNPKGIHGLGDLVRQGITFINRQAGSGTRVLLDYKLGLEGVDSAAIRGYDIVEYTHTAVAVAVKSAAADAGLGIFAAAKALDLDFIPVVSEQYDLVVPSAFLEDERVRKLLDAARSSAFRETVRTLGGYDPDKSGELWTEIG